MKIATSRTLVLAIVAACTTAARADFLINYYLDLADGESISRGMVYNTYPNGGAGATWAFGAPSGASVWTDPFPKNTAVNVASLIGLSGYDESGSTPTATGLYLGLNNSDGELALGHTFEEVFSDTTYTEQEMIDAVLLATSGQDWPIIQPGLDKVFDFMGHYQSRLSAYNTHSMIVGFSDGRMAGTLYTVPEPTSFLAVGLGIGALALRRKRK